MYYLSVKATEKGSIVIQTNLNLDRKRERKLTQKIIKRYEAN
jgi:hypothetical protein